MDCFRSKKGEGLSGVMAIKEVDRRSHFCGRIDYLLMYCHSDGKKSRKGSENICNLPQLVR
jgi:hypothetical protein